MLFNSSLMISNFLISLVPSDTHIKQHHLRHFIIIIDITRWEMRLRRRLFELVIKEVRLREEKERKSGQLVDEDSVQCLNDTFFIYFILIFVLLTNTLEIDGKIFTDIKKKKWNVYTQQRRRWKCNIKKREDEKEQ